MTKIDFSEEVHQRQINGCLRRFWFVITARLSLSGARGIPDYETLGEAATREDDKIPLDKGCESLSEPHFRFRPSLSRRHKTGIALGGGSQNPSLPFAGIGFASLRGLSSSN